MFVEIGINTMKADYFKTKEEIYRIETICECLDIDYRARWDSPFQFSEVRIVCSNNKAKKFLKLIKLSNLKNCVDHLIHDVKDKRFLLEGTYE